MLVHFRTLIAQLRWMHVDCLKSALQLIKGSIMGARTLQLSRKTASTLSKRRHLLGEEMVRKSLVIECRETVLKVVSSWTTHTLVLRNARVQLV